LAGERSSALLYLKNKMKAIKVYQTTIYGYLSKNFIIDGKEVNVIFQGGENNKGVYQTDVVAIQEKLEKSPAFKKDYILKATLKDVETVAVPPVAGIDPSDPPVDPPANPVEVKTNDEGIEEVAGIVSFQTAKKYLIDNKQVTPDQVPNKVALLQVCESLKVKFVDMK
jgi:hypothetical protein